MILRNDLIVIAGVSIVDVINGSASTGDIILCGERIKQVSYGHSAYSNVQVFDAKKLWALPAFIDVHTHVSFSPSGSWNLNAIDCDDVIGFAQTNLHSALLSGVCLVRDLGCKQSHYKDILSASFGSKSVEVIWSGEPLCIGDGHGSSFGATVSNIEQAKLVVQKHCVSGFTWLKIMNDPERFPKNFLDEIIKFAHENRLKVAVHTFTPRSINDAVNAGADTIEHSLPFCRLPAQAKKNRQFFVPTCYSSFLSTFGFSYQSKASSTDYRYIQCWNKLLKMQFEKKAFKEVTLLAGTDGGCSPSRLCDLPHEIIQLNKLGLDCAEALRSATIHAAECLGCEDDYGSIKSGKLANIVLCDSNPLISIETIINPVVIINRGDFIYERIEYAS